MSRAPWTVREASTDDLQPSRLSDIRRLMDAAFGDDFSEEDWDHALGGRHFLVWTPEGSLACHAAVVPRALEVADEPVPTGYVEAVATRPDLQRRGLATAVMRAVDDHLQERFRLGALCASIRFYEGLGWIRWRGATWCRREGRLFRTADEDGNVWVLPTGSSPPLDFGSDIAADWREGDVW